MSSQYYTAAEIAQAEGVTERSINNLAKKQGWRGQGNKARKRPGRGGGWEYHVSLLPDMARARLTIGIGAEEVKAQSSAAWIEYERLSTARKKACEERLKVVDAVADLVRSGMKETSSVAYVSKQTGKSERSIRSWRKKVAHVDRADWLPALADNYKPTAQFDDVHPEAWTALKSDYLRPEKPSFSSCARRVKQAAKDNGWGQIPSEQSLRRRFFAEIPQAVITMARKGKDAAKGLYPAQRRDRSGLHAMQAVNMDGHKFDVFIKVKGFKNAVRIILVALQDLYSDKIVAWRLDISENKDAVRLCIGDMVERHGIPEKILLDNGRAFASKEITGQIKTRYRFKVKDEDPEGLLKSLGIEVIWATPYAGQSKPIERSFKDLCDSIAKHPFCAGAYTGNKPEAKPENYNSRAIPFEDFSNFVDMMIAEHNARPGRQGGNANGRSFDQTFTDSLAEPTTLIKWPTKAQRALWLMAQDSVRTKKGSGEIHLFQNRYWHPALNEFAGKKVTVRFDPDNLAQPLHVYDPNGKLICMADCVNDTGFFDRQAARDHNRMRKRHIKATKELQTIETGMAPRRLAEFYGADKIAAKPQPEPPVHKRLAVGGTAQQPVRQQNPWTDEYEDVFTRAMNREDAKDPKIVKFPKG